MKGGNRPAAHRAEGRWIKPNVNSGKQYEIALTSILTAFLLRLSIDSFLVDHLAYVTSILAITLTTWYECRGFSHGSDTRCLAHPTGFSFSLATNSA